MTFENEEGYQRAINYNDITSTDTRPIVRGLAKWLGDQEIEVQPASEPSDIIWENRHFTPAQRLTKTIFAWTIIGVLLFGSFCAIFVAKDQQVKVVKKYPPV